MNHLYRFFVRTSCVERPDSILIPHAFFNVNVNCINVLLRDKTSYYIEPGLTPFFTFSSDD